MMTKNLLTDNFSEPLNEVITAKVEIHAGDGNLTIDKFTGEEQVLASGTLQYFEQQGLPTRNLDSSNGQATFTLRGGSTKQPWLRLPWSTCNGATEWRIYLNPTIPSDITAHSGGGNIKLNLAGMSLTRLSADTGGGNMELTLPGDAGDLSVTAKTGAGNVIVYIPNDVAARIHASTGLGKSIVDPRFNKTDKDIYQSPDFDSAVHRVEITAHSGAGNVIVSTQ